MTFDPVVQISPNGELTPEFRARVRAVRDALGLTLNQLGESIGFSGTFLSKLIREKNAARMGSKWAPIMLSTIIQLEKKAEALEEGHNFEPKTGADPHFGTDLLALIRRIEAMGLRVHVSSRV